MKIVSLVYGYSAKNAGDFAITLGAIDVLMAAGYKIKLFSRYCKKNRDYHESKEMLQKRYGDLIEIYECPFNLDRSKSKLQTLYDYIKGLMLCTGLRKDLRFVNKLLDCDIVAFNGGNLFRCESFIDLARLSALMFPLQIALHKKPIIILPQSASRLNWMGRKMLLPILKHARCVFFREKESYNYISNYMSPSCFKQTIDLAFFIKKDSVHANYESKKKIAFTLRTHTVGDIKLLKQDEIDKIDSNLEMIIDRYKKQYDFVVVVQTQKDKKHSEEFATKNGIEIFESYNVDELMNFYKNIDILVGMRLHSIILALSVGTPCYGMFYKQWGLKNSGLMEYFKLPYDIIEDKRDCEIEKIDNLLVNRSFYSSDVLKLVGEEKLKFEKQLIF